MLFIGVRLAIAERILAGALVTYIACDILLTPPAHLETRDPSHVGIATLALLFVRSLGSAASFARYGTSA
jgi:hypothetical protein